MDGEAAYKDASVKTFAWWYAAVARERQRVSNMAIPSGGWVESEEEKDLDVDDGMCGGVEVPLGRQLVKRRRLDEASWDWTRALFPS